MPFAIAMAAHFSSALAAFGPFATVNAPDLVRFNPFSTASGWAVNAVMCRVLGKLSVPILLELVVEQTIHMSQGDVLFTAAFWRHMLRIRN